MTVVNLDSAGIDVYQDDLVAVGTDLPVDALVSVFRTVGPGAGVRLLAAPLVPLLIFNADAAVPLNVYPPAGMTIIGHAPNVPISLVRHTGAAFLPLVTDGVLRLFSTEVFT